MTKPDPALDPDRMENRDCEMCSSPIRPEQTCCHFVDHDGEHLFHIGCHDRFMQERGTGITDVYIYEGGQDDV